MEFAERGRVVMDGFLKPVVPELKIKDYKTYHAFRCGMCQRLRQDYGIFARKLLSADTILIAILCDSLAGREGTCKHKRCRHNPLRECDVLSQTRGIQLAAKFQLILTWQKLQDTEARNKSIPARVHCAFLRMLLKKSYHKALENEGAEIERVLVQARAHSQALALTGCTDYNIASEAFANSISSLYLHCSSDDGSWKYLQQFGYHLGCINFFVRSVEWYDQDKALGNYNIFIQNGLTKAAAIETAKHHCNLSAVELAKATALLNLQTNRSLLDNIIYLGLEHAVEELGQPASDVWAL